MANETFNLAILLSLKDQATGGLDKFATKLRNIGNLSRTTLSDLNKLYAKLGASVSTSGFDHATGQARTLGKEIRGAAKDYETLRRGLGRDSAIGKKGTPSATRDIDAGIGTARRGRKRKQETALDHIEDVNTVVNTTGQIADAWRSRADSMRPYIDATLELSRAQEKFKAINLSPQDNTRAFAAVNQTVRNIRGVTLTDATKLITDLHTATGSLEHAVESLPIASKYQFAFSSLFGDKFSSDQIEGQIQNAFKYLEMTGKVAQGREAMERSFNVMAQMGAATGGRVNPEEMLLMARRGGASVRGLSDLGLRNMSAVIQELGGSGAGTSMMSVYQELVGGVMKQSAAMEFQRLGFLDKSKIEFNKSGIIKRVMPGGNALGSMVMEDPLKAADALTAAMRAKGITSDKDIRNELAVLFQNRTANKLMDTLITQRPQVVKESNLAAGAKDIEQLNTQALDSAAGKMKTYETAVTNFKTAIGTGLLPLLTTFAGKLTPIANYFAEHENIAKWAAYILLGSKAAGGLLETASLFGQGGGKAISLIRWLSSSTSEAAALEKAVTGASTKTGALATKWGSLKAGAGTITLGIAVAGFTIEQLMTLLDKIDELNKAEAGNRKTQDMNLRSSRNYVDKSKAAGVPLDRNIMRGSAAADFATIDQEGTLKQAMRGGFKELLRDAFHVGAPSDKGWDKILGILPVPSKWNLIGNIGAHALTGSDNRPFSYGISGVDNYAKQVHLIRDRAKDLAVPEHMAEMRKYISGIKDVPESGKNWFTGLLQKSFTESFNQSTQILARESQGVAEQTSTISKALGDLLQPTNNTTQGFMSLLTPLGNTPQPFRDAGGAASAFADQAEAAAGRISNVKIEVPQASPVPNVNNQPQAQPPTNKQSSLIPSRFNKVDGATPRTTAYPTTLASLRAFDADRQRNSAQTFPVREQVKQVNGDAVRPRATQPTPDVALASLRGFDADRQRTDTRALRFSRPIDADGRRNETRAYPRAASFDKGHSEIKARAMPQTLAFSSSRGGREGARGGVQIGAIHLNIPAGSKAGENPQELARLVGNEVSRKVDEVMRDSYRIAALMRDASGRYRERG